MARNVNRVLGAVCVVAGSAALVACGGSSSDPAVDPAAGAVAEAGTDSASSTTTVAGPATPVTGTLEATAVALPVPTEVKVVRAATPAGPTFRLEWAFPADQQVHVAGWVVEARNLVDQSSWRQYWRSPVHGPETRSAELPWVEGGRTKPGNYEVRVVALAPGYDLNAAGFRSLDGVSPRIVAAVRDAVPTTPQLVFTAAAPQTTFDVAARSVSLKWGNLAELDSGSGISDVRYTVQAYRYLDELTDFNVPFAVMGDSFRMDVPAGAQGATMRGIEAEWVFRIQGQATAGTSSPYAARINEPGIQMLSDVAPGPVRLTRPAADAALPQTWSVQVADASRVATEGASQVKALRQAGVDVRGVACVMKRDAQGKSSVQVLVALPPGAASIQTYGWTAAPAKQFLNSTAQFSVWPRAQDPCLKIG